MKKLKIVQIKSRINKPAVQKRTLDALGLRKLHKEVIVEGTPQIVGMINKVKHLIRVEEV